MAFSNGSAELSRAPLDAAINLMGSTCGLERIRFSKRLCFLGIRWHNQNRFAVGEDVVEPERNLPIGMFYSLGIAMFLYAGISYTLFSVFDGASLGIGNGGYPTKAPMYFSHLKSVAMQSHSSSLSFAIYHERRRPNRTSRRI